MHRKNGRPITVPFREPQGVSDDRVYCAERGPLCGGCPYPRHGFICWFGDGACLKTEYNRITGGNEMKSTADSFSGYTLEDCACIYCFYRKKKEPCPLPVCCCAEEKRLAREKEHIQSRKSADEAQCPA